MCVVLAALGGGVLTLPAQADDQTYDTPSGLQVPRWAMLRRNEVYARNGPSKDNRVVWTYHKASLPVQIISETRDWRLICDPDGGVAWVSKTMIQAQKTVMSPAGQKLQMHQSPDEKADIKAILKPKALASLDKCKKGWCRISAAGQTGWVPQPSLWGTQATAVCKRPDPFAAR
jgi:SH3-like domain-containing protein